MTDRFPKTDARRITALIVVLGLLAPVLALPAQAQLFHRAAPTPAGQQKKGMSTKQKVVLLAGAALVYYLYRKYQAKKAAEAAAAPAQAGVATGTTAASARPQLYRSKNGGVYYRDPNGKPVWLTAPQQRMEVPASDVRQYAPDYNRYQGQAAPRVPSGAPTRSFSDLDNSLVGSGSAPSGPPGPRH